MRNWLRTTLAAAALALPLLAGAASPPKPFSAEYEVRRNDQRLGTGQVSLRHMGGKQYLLVTQSKGTEGLAAMAGIEREERSLLTWTGDGFEMAEYHMLQQAAWKKRQQQLRMDPVTRRVGGNWRDDVVGYAGEPGLLDQHGTTAAIMVALAAGERGQLDYRVAGRRGIETQSYRVAAPVRLRTAIGTKRALRVERVRGSDTGRITKLWFAREHGWLPLRIKQYESDGETLDLRITAIR